MPTRGSVKTKKMLDTERRIGRPLEDALVEEINATGTVEEAAERLGLSGSTARWWCWRLGIGLDVRTYATRERPPAAANAGASPDAAG